MTSRYSRAGASRSGVYATAAQKQSVGEALRSPGKLLDSAERSWAEAHFGHDFSQVRVHSGPRASESAGALDAAAYTLGPHIVFARDRFQPHTAAGRRLLAHELAHVVQQRSFAADPAAHHLPLEPHSSPLEREAGNAAAEIMKGGAAPALTSTLSSSLARNAATPAPPQSDFDDCDQAMQADLRAKHPLAMQHVRDAIASLAPGWAHMTPANKAQFQQHFDPAASGDVDESFVRDVRNNFGRILGFMQSLHFDCSPGARSICGGSRGWCVGGRLMWTCFGNIYVCRNAYPTAPDPFKIATIIHESTHNALLTTDRAYSNQSEFGRLRPRGSGFGRFLNILSNIPVLGILFRALPGNNDTINNPDSYSGYAMQATP